MDRFDAIGRLEDELAQNFEGLTPDWEVRGADPVLTLRGEGLELELVPQDGGRFELRTTLEPEQVSRVLTLLSRRATPMPTPAPTSSSSSGVGLRTRSRRLAAVV